MIVLEWCLTIHVKLFSKYQCYINSYFIFLVWVDLIDKSQHHSIIFLKEKNNWLMKLCIPLKNKIWVSRIGPQNLVLFTNIYYFLVWASFLPISQTRRAELTKLVIWDGVLYAVPRISPQNLLLSKYL